jgi:hypothetical protein
MPILTRSVSSLPDFIKQVLSIRDQWQKENDEDARKTGGEIEPLQIWCAATPLN